MQSPTSWLTASRVALQSPTHSTQTTGELQRAPSRAPPPPPTRPAEENASCSAPPCPLRAPMSLHCYPVHLPLHRSSELDPSNELRRPGAPNVTGSSPSGPFTYDMPGTQYPRDTAQLYTQHFFCPVLLLHNPPDGLHPPPPTAAALTSVYQANALPAGVDPSAFYPTVCCVFVCPSAPCHLRGPVSFTIF